MVVLRQHLPLGPADALAEAVRVEGRHRHEGEHVAARDVHGDERARLVAHAPRRILLKALVDRQLDGLAAAVGLGIELLDQLASGGDLDALAAGLSAKIRLERLFEALLADLEARDDQQRVLVLRLIFLGVGGPDIADQVGDGRAVRDNSGKSRGWPGRRADREGGP